MGAMSLARKDKFMADKCKWVSFGNSGPHTHAHVLWQFLNALLDAFVKTFYLARDRKNITHLLDHVLTNVEDKVKTRGRHPRFKI
jgi:hypothetical protein